jgi:L-asparaginase II
MTARATGPIAATTYRGEAIENTHIAHVAVVDAQGRLLYAFGDPTRMTLARSAAKPAQALAVLETGALERFGFEEADLALMCGSHNSEERHIERARQMIAKAHASEADLRCGGHPPLSDAVFRSWIKRDFTPGAVCSNCSGKHAGMLAGAQAIGAAVQDYHRPDHPLQVRVKHTVAQVCDLPDEGVQWAVDGCNLPTPAFPLDRRRGNVSAQCCARAHLSRDDRLPRDGRRRRTLLYCVDAQLRRGAGRQGGSRRELCDRRPALRADGTAWRQWRARDCGEGGRR